MDEDLDDVIHGDVYCYFFIGIEDGWDLDLDSLLRDGDLLLGKHLVVANPDGATLEGTPVAGNGSLCDIGL